MVSEGVETILMLTIGFGLGWLAHWGMRRGIGEARFDSETGKRIK